MARLLNRFYRKNLHSNSKPILRLGIQICGNHLEKGLTLEYRVGKEFSLLRFIVAPFLTIRKNIKRKFGLTQFFSFRFRLPFSGVLCTISSLYLTAWKNIYLSIWYIFSGCIVAYLNKCNLKFILTRLEEINIYDF